MLEVAGVTGQCYKAEEARRASVLCTLTPPVPGPQAVPRVKRQAATSHMGITRGILSPSYCFIVGWKLRRDVRRPEAVLLL